jgi:hypothetical protein
VPYKQLAAQEAAFTTEQPAKQPAWGRTVKFDSTSEAGEVAKRQAIGYNPDGMVVMADPTLRPPEVRRHVLS